MTKIRGEGLGKSGKRNSFSFLCAHDFFTASLSHWNSFDWEGWESFHNSQNIFSYIIYILPYISICGIIRTISILTLYKWTRVSGHTFSWSFILISTHKRKGRGRSDPVLDFSQRSDPDPFSTLSDKNHNFLLKKTCRKRTWGSFGQHFCRDQNFCFADFC